MLAQGPAAKGFEAAGFLPEIPAAPYRVLQPRQRRTGYLCRGEQAGGVKSLQRPFCIRPGRVLGKYRTGTDLESSSFRWPAVKTREINGAGFPGRRNRPPALRAECLQKAGINLF